jgi:hypothetical protein
MFVLIRAITYAALFIGFLLVFLPARVLSWSGIVRPVSIGAAQVAGVRAVENVAPAWDPNAFRDQSTLQIMTTSADEGEHWSNLWLVIVDGQLYVRLGDRAFGRVQKNTTSPHVKVKIAGREFERVRLEAAPDMTDKVAAAMADKYFMDILVRHESHPMTARLVAEAAPAAPVASH